MRWASSQTIRSQSGPACSSLSTRPRGHVEPQDKAVLLDKRVARQGSLNLIACEDLEAEAEFLGHLILPLLDWTQVRRSEIVRDRPGLEAP